MPQDYAIVLAEPSHSPGQTRQPRTHRGRNSADQAEYTASDGRFVLSGGKPTIIDASADTTTGHSLTFFVANDTILIDSQEGSRTLTKHRVEK